MSENESTLEENESDQNQSLPTKLNALQSENELFKKEIVKLKTDISYYKNETFQFTENLTRQNDAFLSWQKQLQGELAFLTSILSGRQKKKYEVWKEETLKKQTLLEMEKKNHEVEDNISPNLKSSKSMKSPSISSSSILCFNASTASSSSTFIQSNSNLSELTISDQPLSPKNNENNITNNINNKNKQIVRNKKLYNKMPSTSSFDHINRASSCASLTNFDSNSNTNFAVRKMQNDLEIIKDLKTENQALQIEKVALLNQLEAKNAFDHDQHEMITSLQMQIQELSLAFEELSKR